MAIVKELQANLIYLQDVADKSVTAMNSPEIAESYIGVFSDNPLEDNIELVRLIDSFYSVIGWFEDE